MELNKLRRGRDSNPLSARSGHLISNQAQSTTLMPTLLMGIETKQLGYFRLETSPGIL
jgi:hypothetical protein